MTDDEPLPKKLARMNRLKDKLEREDDLSEREWQQLRQDHKDVHTTLSGAIEPLVEAYTDFANSMLEGLQPVIETLGEVQKSEAHNND